MNFDDTPEEAAFRAEVRAWLDANAKRRSTREEEFGAGLNAREYLAAAKAWQAKKAAAGYAAITWPKEVGGRDGTPAQQVIFKQEESHYLLPSQIFEVSLGMCLPTVMMWAPPDLQQRFIRPGLSGQEIWCQLFSEPAAGSDTGGIRTRAEKRGDEWVVNGQKVWTSVAHISDFGILLARTDWDKPKQKGLTMFILDMKSPGVEIRPIRQITGGSEFNEVFFNDVVIPVAHQLGGEGDGWKVMLSTLMHERLSVGGNFATNTHERLIALARRAEWNGRPAIEDARVRAAVADAYIGQFGVELIIRRAISAISRGGVPGPEMSAVKLLAAKATQDLGGYALELAGPEGLIGHEALGGEWRIPQIMWLGGPGARLAGGTDEILRNVIAERVLGLPGEIRTDRDKPFRELEA